MNGFLMNLFSVLRINHDFDLLFHRNGRNICFYLMKYVTKDRMKFANLGNILKSSFIQSSVIEMSTSLDDESRKGDLFTVTAGYLRLKRLANGLSAAIEMGLPLICWNLINDFPGPMYWAIPFETVNVFEWFTYMSPLFSKQQTISSKKGMNPSHLESYGARPVQWHCVSLPTFLTYVEVVALGHQEKTHKVIVEDMFRYAFFTIM
jgi:hypothetical protein